MCLVRPAEQRRTSKVHLHNASQAVRVRAILIPIQLRVFPQASQLLSACLGRAGLWGLPSR